MPVGAIPFPFGDCRICCDKATGVHYGVATCEGCKGFFRRSIPKGEKYKCFFGGQCVISPQNRNRCKACRFKKCLDRGMAIDAVKMGRIPKIEKEKALEAAKSCPPVELMETSPGSSSDYQNNGISDASTIAAIDIKQEAGPSFPSCDKHDYYDNFNHDSYNLTALWQNFNVDSSARDINTDSLFSPSGQSSMINNQNFHNIPPPTTSSSQSSDDSSRSSHFSPDVIKVLFDQALEKRGGQHIKDRILQRLANHCPDTVDGGINVLQSLSSTATTSSGYGLQDQNISYERIDSPPSTGLDMRMIRPMDYSDNHHETVSHFSQPDVSHFSQPSPAVSTFSQPSANLHHRCSHLPNNSKAFDDPDSTLQRILVISDSDSSESNVPYSKPSSRETYQSDLMSATSRVTHLSGNQTEHSEMKVPSFQVNINKDIFLDSDYIALTSKVKHYSMEDIYFMIERSNKKRVEMADWMTKTISQIEKAITNFSSHLKENRDCVSQFFKDKRELPVEKKTPETLKMVWDWVIQGIPIVNKRILGFCNSVPGFSSLCPEDQQPMLKFGYYSIWMLTTSEFFINGDSYLRFPNGKFYTRFWMENFLGEKRVKHIFSFSEKFNKLKLTEMEVHVVAAIALLTYDYPEDFVLKNAQSVQILNLHYVDILVELINQSHPDNICHTLLELFNMFPHLYYINQMQREMAAEFLLNKHPSPDKGVKNEETVQSRQLAY